MFAFLFLWLIFIVKTKSESAIKRKIYSKSKRWRHEKVSIKVLIRPSCNKELKYVSLNKNQPLWHTGKVPEVEETPNYKLCNVLKVSVSHTCCRNMSLACSRCEGNPLLVHTFETTEYGYNVICHFVHQLVLP